MSMVIKKKSVNYAIGLYFWRDVPKPNVNAAIKKRMEFVQKMRLGGIAMIWQGSGNADKNKLTLGNLSIHVWFTAKANWQKAVKKMDADERFVYRPEKSPEAHKRYRGYRFIQPAKVRVGK